MPRGRYWYGPGFWKQGRGWVPGAGGFRGGAGGADFYDRAGAFWPNRCRWFGYPHPGYGFGFYPAWLDESVSQDEATILRNQAQMIKTELEEIEKRLAELEKEQ